MKEKYIGKVLHQVQFKEAHPEITKELMTHIDELTESLKSYIPSEDQLQKEVLKRMGNPEDLGNGLNKVHQPKLDFVLITLLSFLLLTGVKFMTNFGLLPNHGLWVLIGIVAAATFTFMKPTQWERFSLIGFVAVLIVTCFSFFSSKFEGGQPYLSFPGLNIKIIDLSAAIFTLMVPGVLKNKFKMPVIFLYLLLSIPFWIFLKTGSAFSIVSYGIALFGMLAIFSESILPMLFVSFSGAAGIFLWPFSGKNFASAENMENLKQSSEKHTDFIMSTINESSFLLSAIVIICAAILCIRLFQMGRIIKSSSGKMTVTGTACFITVGTLWGVLSNLGYLPLPIAGINFPFISYGGSLMVAQLAMIGVALGHYKRRTLAHQ